MSFRSAIVLDVHGIGVPTEVKEAMAKYWRDNELGNDYYYVRWYADELYDDNNEYQAITDYITKNGENPFDGSVLIHFWW